MARPVAEANGGPDVTGCDIGRLRGWKWRPLPTQKLRPAAAAAPSANCRTDGVSKSMKRVGLRQASISTLSAMSREREMLAHAPLEVQEAGAPRALP
jgi:hypothetical protein